MIAVNSDPTQVTRGAREYRSDGIHIQACPSRPEEAEKPEKQSEQVQK